MHRFLLILLLECAQLAVLEPLDAFDTRHHEIEPLRARYLVGDRLRRRTLHFAVDVDMEARPQALDVGWNQRTQVRIGLVDLRQRLISHAEIAEIAERTVANGVPACAEPRSTGQGKDEEPKKITPRTSPPFSDAMTYANYFSGTSVTST